MEQLARNSNISRYNRHFQKKTRIVNIWNSLPSYVVSAETVNCVKTRLDRFWLNQYIIYNFRSEIHGTGSRSEITVKSSLDRVGIIVCYWVGQRGYRLRLFPFYIRLRLRLDKFWQHQDILYDYKVKLIGVRNRSQINADDNIVI